MSAPLSASSFAIFSEEKNFSFWYVSHFRWLPMANALGIESTDESQSTQGSTIWNLIKLPRVWLLAMIWPKRHRRHIDLAARPLRRLRYQMEFTHKMPKTGKCYIQSDCYIVFDGIDLPIHHEWKPLSKRDRRWDSVRSQYINFPLSNHKQTLDWIQSSTTTPCTEAMHALSTRCHCRMAKDASLRLWCACICSEIFLEL